jgi:hypothetical protein
VTIGLRRPCCAQALGDHQWSRSTQASHPWSPVRRMRRTRVPGVQLAQTGKLSARKRLGKINRRSARQGMGKRAAVDVFQLAPHRDAVRDAGHFETVAQREFA